MPDTDTPIDVLLADPLTGEDVREIRDCLELTRVEFARRIGAPVQRDRYDSRTVQRWESGESDPSAQYRGPIRAVARAELG